MNNKKFGDTCPYKSIDKIGESIAKFLGILIEEPVKKNKKVKSNKENGKNAKKIRRIRKENR